MFAAATRPRPCRTPSTPSSWPAIFPARCSSTGSTTSSTPTTPCPCKSPTRKASPHAPASSASDGDLVVTYDDYYGIFAARVAWAFRYYGAEARVLDGGWSTWQDEGRPVSDQTGALQRRTFSARTRPRLRRTLTDVAAASARGAALVDARPRHVFLGEQGVANTGHIPGARCLPYQELVDGATGLWAAPEAVRRLARDAGIDPDQPPTELIATCGTGVSATVALFSLERIGVHCDGVYDGSFNEWGADPSRPVAYGAATYDTELPPVA